MWLSPNAINIATLVAVLFLLGVTTYTFFILRTPKQAKFRTPQWMLGAEVGADGHLVIKVQDGRRARQYRTERKVGNGWIVCILIWCSVLSGSINPSICPYSRRSHGKG